MLHRTHKVAEDTVLARRRTKQPDHGKSSSVSSVHTGEKSASERASVDATSSGAPIAALTASSRRRPSMKMPGLKRAVSFSNLRELTIREGLPLSPVDKKRNKLSYHRTAVACGMPMTMFRIWLQLADEDRPLSQKKNQMHTSRRRPEPAMPTLHKD